MASLGLRLGGRVLQAAKTTTGIVGLLVVPDARNVLMSISQKVLKDVKALPETAHYRQAVEKTYTHRLEVCQLNAEVEAIEAAIGQGQIEELIKMAKDEERLIPKMAEWKPWDVPDDYKVPCTEAKDFTAKPAPKKA